MEKLKAGKGELFMPYDADESRHFFKEKNKKLINKLTTVTEAVKKYIPDGTYIAVGGFGGVAAMVVDILQGKDREEMTWDYQRNAPHAEAMRTLYKKRGDNWQGYDEMITILRNKGIAGINNLLTEEEHKLLFNTRDPILMASIIIKGLGECR